MHVSEINAKDGIERRIDHLEKELKKTIKVSQAIVRNLGSLWEIKEALKDDNHTAAKEYWDDIPEHDKHYLLVAPSKGGAFSTQERAIVSTFWKQIGV